MPTPPTFTKVNPADQPILYLVITSTTLPPWTLDEYAQTRIAQRISMVNGVAQVQVLGSQKYAVHVQLDPHALAARQIGINEVETALRNWNVNVPAGTLISFRATSADVVHGLLIDHTNINSMLVPGYVSVLPARFDTPGEHPMPCQEFCGMGHEGMWAKVKVIDKATFFKMAADKRRLTCVE
jgi:heme/copper-type cytochrome/quinol oxidase subunit 2